MNEFNEYAAQGWQCPICKRVYSPSTFMCYYCGNITIRCDNTAGNQDPVIAVLDRYTRMRIDDIGKAGETK